MEKRNEMLTLAEMNSLTLDKSSHPEVFSGKCVVKMCSKFIGEYSC